MTMNKQVIIGSIGERCIQSICEAHGYQVEVSDDPYDSFKDMRINGKTVEIKTQAPFYIKRWLTFDISQEKKMRNVDLLLVVGYNTTTKEKFDWANKIWRIRPGFEIMSKFIIPGGEKKMFAISVNDPAVTKWYDTPEQTVKLLAKSTTSKFK